MATALAPTIMLQLGTVSEQLSKSVFSASQHLSAVETQFQALGTAYTNDPQAADHLDIFRNNANSLAASAMLLGLIVKNNEPPESTLEMLSKLSGWKLKPSHVPVEDGHPHAPRPPVGHTREAATREMTRYFGDMVEKHAGSMTVADAANLKREFEGFTKAVGQMYRYLETAEKLMSAIHPNGESASAAVR